MTQVTAESVFSAAVVRGGVEGSLVSPGEMGLYVLFTEQEMNVSAEAIRKVYEEQAWDDTTSLDLAQFTLVWSAAVGDGGRVVRQRARGFDCRQRQRR